LLVFLSEDAARVERDIIGGQISQHQKPFPHLVLRNVGEVQQILERVAKIGEFFSIL